MATGSDEVYLVVRDNSYDASSFGLPQIGYRRGDLGGAIPGPDASWEAAALLATINVPALAATIDAGNLTDERGAASLLNGLSVTDHGQLTGLGDDDHPQYLNNARHDTTTRHGSSVVDHGFIGGLGDDDHPQYILKSLVNAKGDVVVATSSDSPARLAVGVNGDILTADSSRATGLKWDTPAIADGVSDMAVSQDTTTSSIFADTLASGSATVGKNGVAIVSISVAKPTTVQETSAYFNFRMSISNTRNPGIFNDDNLELGVDSSYNSTYSRTWVLTGLSPGVTFFAAQLRSASSGSVTGAQEISLDVLTI